MSESVIEPSEWFLICDDCGHAGRGIMAVAPLSEPENVRLQCPECGGSTPYRV